MITTDEEMEIMGKNMLHQREGIWFVNGSVRTKLAIKVSSFIIQAIAKQCKFLMSIAVGEIAGSPVYHVGAIIYDDPVHYFNMARSITIESELYAIRRILKNEIIEVGFYNELSVNVMSAIVYINPAERMAAIKMLNAAKKPFVSHSFDDLSKSRGVW